MYHLDIYLIIIQDFLLGKISPNLFTISWIALTVGILYLLPKKIRIITYPILVILANIITYAEYLHFKILNRFFSFSDLMLVGEEKDYFAYALGKTNFKILFILCLSIVVMIMTLLLMKKSNELKKDKCYYILLVVIATILTIGTRSIAYYKLGEKVNSVSWEAAFIPKNVYLDSNNSNKCIEVSGIYEFIFRNAYLFIKDNYFSNKEQLVSEIDEILENKESKLESNKYTSTIEKKNIIFILMESIDSWLLNETVMPTLYNLSKEGLNFTNRYSPAFGGGQTINSEFASNTGLYAINNGKAIYNYDTNNFSNSLANMLKQNGYSTVSIHANTGSFYNRTAFHKALGFESHYSLNDMIDVDRETYNYYKDSNLIKCEKVYNMIKQGELFFTFITTFSAHLPYDSTNEICKSDPYNLNVKNNQELSCIRNLAKETDEMIRLLIEKLKEDNILKDTVLVLASDHYTYGYSDIDYIKKYKNVNNNYLVQHVPFIIWNNSLNHQEINTIMDTADIVPTLLNMLGIKYNPNYYSGTDVFSKNHNHFVYFAEDIFYDGNIFYDGSYSLNSDDDYIKEVLTTIKNTMSLNDKFIISNYFNKDN